MRVGGCLLDVRSAMPLAALSPDPAYREFLIPSPPRTADTRFRIRLRAGIPSGLNSLPVLCDGSPAWVMRTDGKARWIIRPSPSSRLPFWAAKVARGGCRATVFCGDAYAPAGPRGRSIVNPVTYPLDQLLLMGGLAPRSGVLLHGAGLALPECGFAFLGKSGAGKTTLSRLLSAAGLGTLLSDDRIIVRKRPSGFRLYGTPWPGDGGFAANLDAPLTAVFFLAKGARNRVVPLSVTEALPRLLAVASLPWYDADALPTALAACQELMLAVPAFELQFVPGPGIAGLVARFGRRRRKRVSN